MPTRIVRSLFSRGAGQLGGPRVYSTSFPLTENPLNDNSAWTMHGKSTGLDWDDCASTAGNMHGVYVNAKLGDFADPTSLLGGPWSADQEAEGTIYGVSALSSGCNQEIEIRLRSLISPHVNRGYEFGIRAKAIGETNYAFIARWNGALGDFTAFNFVNNFALADGDVMRARTTTSTSGGGPSVLLQLWLNDVLMVQDSDSTLGQWTNGNPGVGIYISPFTDSGCFSTPTAFGFSSYTAREIVT